MSEFIKKVIALGDTLNALLTANQFDQAVRMIETALDNGDMSQTVYNCWHALIASGRQIHRDTLFGRTLKSVGNNYTPAELDALCTEWHDTQASLEASVWS